MNDNKNFKKWIPPFMLGILLIIFLQLFNYFSTIIISVQAFFGALSPFFLGAIVAYVLNIPRKKIESLLLKLNVDPISKHSRGISVIATYLLAIFGIILAFNAVVPILVVGVIELGRILSGHVESLIDSVIYMYSNNSLEAILLETFDIDIQYSGTAFDAILLDTFDFDVQSSVLNLFQTVSAGALRTIGNIAGLTSSLLTLFLGFVSSIYYLLYSDSILKFFVRLAYAFLPKKGADILLRYGRNLNFYFYKYIYCQLLDCLILGTIVSIGLSIIGIEQAIMFGILLAALNIIPYFGSIFGSIFVIIFIVFTDSFTTALISGLFLLITQQLDGNFIQPKLMGSSLKLNPLLIIVSISIGSFYFGIIGMIVAIPIASIARDIVVDLMRYSENKKQASSLSKAKGLE